MKKKTERLFEFNIFLWICFPMCFERDARKGFISQHKVWYLKGHLSDMCTPYIFTNIIVLKYVCEPITNIQN